MQLFAGFTDDKPVVIGLSENINRFVWIHTVQAGLFQYINQQELSMIESSMFEKNLAFSSYPAMT